MKVNIDTIKLKRKMSKHELDSALHILDKDPKFRRAIKEFMRLTTS